MRCKATQSQIEFLDLTDLDVVAAQDFYFRVLAVINSELDPCDRRNGDETSDGQALLSLRSRFLVCLDLQIPTFEFRSQILTRHHSSC